MFLKSFYQISIILTPKSEKTEENHGLIFLMYIHAENPQ